MCLPPDKGLYLFPANKVVDYNVVEQFYGREVLGSGSFGEVRPVPFPESFKYGPLVAKKIDVSNYYLEGGDTRVNKKVGRELEVGIVLHFGDVGPQIVGCAYIYPDTYIVQQRLLGTLEDPDVQKAIIGLDNYTQISMWADLFYREHYMWDLGFVHQDIKPANVMLSHDKKKIYLIDFGIVQQFEKEVNTGSGTPMFKSFDKYYNSRLTVLSDIYATALTIAVFYSSIERIFSYTDSVRKGDPFADTCFEESGFHECLPHIVQNVKDIFHGSSFGNINTNFKDSYINFSTLIYLCVNYYKNPFNEEALFYFLNILLEKEYLAVAGKGKLEKHIGHQRVEQIINNKQLKFSIQDEVNTGIPPRVKDNALYQQQFQKYRRMILDRQEKDRKEMERLAQLRQAAIEEQRRQGQELDLRLKQAQLIAQQKKQEEDAARHFALEQYNYKKAEELRQSKKQAQLMDQLLEDKKSQARLFYSPSQKFLQMSPSQAKLAQLIRQDEELEERRLNYAPSHKQLGQGYHAPEKPNRNFGIQLPELKPSPSQAKLFEHKSHRQMEPDSPRKRELEHERAKKALVLLKKKQNEGYQQPDYIEEKPAQKVKLPYIGGRIPDDFIAKRQINIPSNVDQKMALQIDQNDEIEANKQYGRRQKEDPRPAKAVYYNDPERIKRIPEFEDDRQLVNRRFRFAKDSVELYKFKDDHDRLQEIYERINQDAGYIEADEQPQRKGLLERPGVPRKFI